MAVEDAASHWPTENLILKAGRKHLRTTIAPLHWQLRSLISAEGNGIVYFPAGSNNTQITRLNTKTRETETIKVLSFHPRCLAAKNGWICCGGESGEFAVIRDVGLTESNGVDDVLSSNFRAQVNSLESTDTSLSQFSDMLERRLNGPNKTWTTSNHKFGMERVNCITIWVPPKQSSPTQAKPGSYATPVAVLANNDKTVTIVGLHDCECQLELEYPDCVNRSVISPDGSMIASICDDPFLYVHVRKLVSRGKIGEVYEWKPLPRIRLKDRQRRHGDPAECRGSFATAFSPSGRYLAVGTQYGTICIYDVAAIQHPDSDPLVTYFCSSRFPQDNGAIRDMAFCPGPYDLLAWTEHRGRIGIADARTNFTQRQIIALDKHEDYDHLSLNESNTIDPRLLAQQRNERAVNAGISAHLHLSSLLSQTSSPRPLPNPEASDPTERLNHPFTPEETAILEAVQNDRRRRELREIREQQIARGNPAWRSSVWAERRETLTRILDRERNRDARDHRLLTAVQQAQALSEQDRERRAPTPRRRSSFMQALAQTAASGSNSNNNNDNSNNETSSSRDSPTPWAAAGRTGMTSGWADLEALYNISGGNGESSTRAETTGRTRRAIPNNDVWNDERLDGFVARRTYGRLNSNRDHIQYPDDTAGLTWSEDGQTLYVGCEDGVYEFHVNLQGRKVFPQITLR